MVQKWTCTTNGPIGDGSYYIRISGSGSPDDSAVRTWANGAGQHPENSVTDAGFLELVRLGVKPPGDTAVAHLLAAVDASLKVSACSGDLWKRYTCDGYAETTTGAPWTGTGIGGPGPCCPASGASTNSPPDTTRCHTWSPWRTPPTTAS